MTHPDDVATTGYGSAPGPQVAFAEGELLAAGLPFAVLDIANRRLVDANPAFAALVHLDLTQVKGLDFLSLVPPQNRALIEAVLTGMGAGTIRFLEGPTWWQLPSGESLHVERWLRCVDDGSTRPRPCSPPSLPAVLRLPSSR